MAYQMTVTLTDQEYQMLAAEAARRGEQPETLLRDMIRHLQSASTDKRPMTGRELAEKLYREGKLASLATQRPLTQEEQEERERGLLHSYTGEVTLRLGPGQASRAWYPIAMLPVAPVNALLPASDQSRSCS